MSKPIGVRFQVFHRISQRCVLTLYLRAHFVEGPLYYRIKQSWTNTRRPDPDKGTISVFLSRNCQYFRFSFFKSLQPISCSVFPFNIRFQRFSIGCTSLVRNRLYFTGQLLRLPENLPVSPFRNRLSFTGQPLLLPENLIVSNIKVFYSTRKPLV